MPENRKPLFSRRYLKALIWLLPGLILLLASAGPDALPDIGRDPARGLYWLDQPERDDNEIRLLFDTGLAIAPHQRVAQKALAGQLQARLQQPEVQVLLPDPGHSEVTALADRLQLKLSWPSALPAPALEPLLKALAQPDAPESLQRRIEQHRAQAYLASQAPDQRLLNLMQASLAGGTPAPVTVVSLQQRQQRLFSRTPLILLGGPDARAMAAQLLGQRPAEMAVAPQPQRLGTEPLRLQIDDSRQPETLLLGALTGGLASDGHATERIALAGLQRLLEQQPALDFRLVWQPLRQRGYRALILRNGVPALEQLAAATDPALIEQARDELLQEYRDRLQTPGGQLDRLEYIAFYGLPDRQLDTQLKMLEQAPVGDIAARITQYLDPEPQIRIELN